MGASFTDADWPQGGALGSTGEDCALEGAEEEEEE